MWSNTSLPTCLKVSVKSRNRPELPNAPSAKICKETTMHTYVCWICLHTKKRHAILKKILYKDARLNIAGYGHLMIVHHSDRRALMSRTHLLFHKHAPANHGQGKRAKAKDDQNKCTLGFLDCVHVPLHRNPCINRAAQFKWPSALHTLDMAMPR